MTPDEITLLTFYRDAQRKARRLAQTDVDCGYVHASAALNDAENAVVRFVRESLAALSKETVK